MSLNHAADTPTTRVEGVQVLIDTGWDRVLAIAARHPFLFRFILALGAIGVAVNVPLAVAHVVAGRWTRLAITGPWLLVCLWLAGVALAALRRTPRPPRYWRTLKRRPTS